MEEISPALTRYGDLEPPSIDAVKAGVRAQLVDANRGEQGKVREKTESLRMPIENFYFTDAISRSSRTMARCSAAKMSKARIGEGPELEPEQAAAGFA